MAVNFVFDKFNPTSNSPVSNLIGSYYDKELREIPYWYEWGGDVNKHLLKDSTWVSNNDVVIECMLTAESWDLHSRCKVLTDIPYLITVDIKLGTADNCNISILDSNIWKLLGGVSFDLVDHQLSRSQWATVTLEMLPSKSGVIHLHIGAQDNKLAKQKPGTVFIKNLRVTSDTTKMVITTFSQQNGNYRILGNNQQNPNSILLSDIDNYKHDFNIYPIVITTAEHIWCWPLLLVSKHIVDLINQDQLKILFLCSFETIKEDFMLIHDQIHKICRFQRIIKTANIIFASTDSSIDQRSVKYKETIKKTKSKHDPAVQLIKFKDINSYGHVVPKMLKSENDIDWIEIYCNCNEKSHIFLYLNNRVTYFRYLLYKQLEYKNLLQHGIYSWNGYVSENTPFDDPISSFKIQFCQLTTENQKHQQFIHYVMANPAIEIVKIKDDSVNLSSDPLREGSKIDQNWIANTYFSVVTETHVGDNPSHVTEKIYKLIFCCHPFIVFGPRHHLATLHRYGFKTFSCLFDESYDSMPDTLEKYNFISDQIKFYTTDKGRKRLKKSLPILRSVLEYNRNHLLSLSSNDVWNSLENLYKDN